MSNNLILAVGGLVVVLLLIVATALLLTGNFRWSPLISAGAKGVWLIGFVITGFIGFAWFGVAEMMSAWPFFLIAPLLTFTLLSLLDWWSDSRDQGV